MSIFLYNIFVIVCDIECVLFVLVEVVVCFQVVILVDVVGCCGILNCCVKLFVLIMKVVGLVVMVEVCFGDNFVIYVVLVVVKFGDVIVVDGKGDQSCVLIGEIMVMQVQVIGIVGFVIDGVVCDLYELVYGMFLIFFVGLNLCGLIKSVVGCVNLFVFVVGVMVYLGDLVVGDVDGVVVILCVDVECIFVFVQKKVDVEVVCIMVICKGDMCLGWFEKELCVVGMLVEGEVL